MQQSWVSYNTPMIDKFKNAKYIFVVGIGGSDLASKAVWNAITLHDPAQNKKIFFFESPDSREYAEVEDFVANKVADLSEIALIAVSKSGGTVETLTAFHHIFDTLSEKFGAPINERVLIVSTPESQLWKLAESKGLERLAWEGDIGGRFSAFTVAHTSVLEIAGLDTQKFKDGKMERLKDWEEKLAREVFDAYQKGNDILDLFIFNSELEDLGKWCRQLVAESLSTLTPTVSLGPTDLHSMLELYLGGPKTRFTIFVRSQKEIAGGVNEEAYQNVTGAYSKANLPFFKYEMPEINEYELGRFMAFMMAFTIALAKLLGVDPFDQPAVEEYKLQVRKGASL